jgi:hypothetical protein
MKEFHKEGFQVNQKLLDKWNYQAQLRAYRKGSRNDWNSPNSSDIHSIYKVKNVGAYIAKYCTKNNPGRKITGNLWNMSEPLSKINGAVDTIDNEIAEELYNLQKERSSQVKQEDYFTLFMLKIDSLNKDKYPRLFAIFHNYIEVLKYKHTKQEVITHQYYY